MSSAYQVPKPAMPATTITTGPAVEYLGFAPRAWCLFERVHVEAARKDGAACRVDRLTRLRITRPSTCEEQELKPSQSADRKEAKESRLLSFNKNSCQFPRTYYDMVQYRRLCRGLDG